MRPLSLIIGIGTCLILSLVLIPILIRLSHRFGWLDQPGRHKRHKQPTPFVGGAALFVASWLTILALSALYPTQFRDLTHSLLYIFSGALVILFVGLADDFVPVSAWVKLAAQMVVGLLLYVGGINVEFLTTPMGSLEIGSFSVVITIVWVVMLTNAINLIDGLDGLAAGVCLIGAATMLVIGQLYQVGAVLVFIVILIGFLVPFLFYNRYPARIFLGDSGSMQIGYYFAVFSLVFPLKSYTATALYLPLLALGVPLLEILSSFLRRLFTGKNILQADRRHLFHYLSLVGFTPRQVLFTFYCLALIYGLFALAMFYWNRVLVFGFLVFFMVVIFTIFFILITKLGPRKRTNGPKNPADAAG